MKNWLQSAFENKRDKKWFYFSKKNWKISKNLEYELGYVWDRTSGVSRNKHRKYSNMEHIVRFLLSCRAYGMYLRNPRRFFGNQVLSFALDLLELHQFLVAFDQVKSVHFLCNPSLRLKYKTWGKKLEMGGGKKLLRIFQLKHRVSSIPNKF